MKHARKFETVFQVVLFLCFVFCSEINSAQSQKIFRIDSIPSYDPTNSRTYGINFPENWKYCKGDNLNWAKQNFSDDFWPYINTKLPMGQLPAGVFEGVGWFRIWIEIDSSLVDKVLGMMIDQSGSSQVYIDGVLTQELGNLSLDDKKGQQRYNSKTIPLTVILKNGKKHLIAVRYSNFSAVAKAAKNTNYQAGFSMSLGKMQEAIYTSLINSLVFTSVFIFYFTFFFAVGFVHMMLFLYYRSVRSNLYYSIFSFLFGIYFLLLTIVNQFFYPDLTDYVSNINHFLPNIYMTALLAMLYSIFNDNKLPKIFWVFFSYFCLDLVFKFFDIQIPYYRILTVAIYIEPLRIVIMAIIKKKDGAWIIGTGVISTIAFFFIFLTMTYFNKGEFASHSPALSFFWAIIVIYFTLNIPMSMSIYLARDFARTNKKLQIKLKEVEELSQKNLEQERERQKILESQNQMLEEKVTERTIEITKQKKVIEEKNKDITDSIRYARRIQQALMPNEKFIQRVLNKLKS